VDQARLLSNGHHNSVPRDRSGRGVEPTTHLNRVVGWVKIRAFVPVLTDGSSWRGPSLSDGGISTFHSYNSLGIYVEIPNDGQRARMQGLGSL
jgi:hypothetical protein